MRSNIFETFGSILSSLKFSLKVFKSFLKTGVISASLNPTAKTDVTTKLLELSSIKYANMSPMFPNYFPRNIVFLITGTKFINLFDDFFTTYL